jgi:antitoxin FitA
MKRVSERMVLMVERNAARMHINRGANREGFMTAISVPLSEERLEKLRDLALRNGVTPEELASDCLEEWLAGRQENFSRAATHVLKKNAELYRRLA